MLKKLGSGPDPVAVSNGVQEPSGHTRRMTKKEVEEPSLIAEGSRVFLGGPCNFRNSQ